MTHFCSDIVKKAFRAAHQQAMNQFGFDDLRYIINQQWRYIYERIAQIDGGFYNQKVALNNRLTQMEPMVLRTVQVFREDPYTGIREIFKHGDNTQYNSRRTYYIEGNDLYCQEAAYNNYIFCEYTPAPKELFFTMNNRTPEYLPQTYVPPPITNRYHSYLLIQSGSNYFLQHINNPSNTYDITPILSRGIGTSNTLYTIASVIPSYPYCFVSYKHNNSGEYSSYILKNLLGAVERHYYNPFEYTGRHSNVKFIEAKHNEDNGMYCVVQDYDDIDPNTGIVPAIKKLGWTPDTVIDFPHDCVFDLLVANTALRIANRNESEFKDIEYMVQKAELELNMWIKKDANNFYRINNTVGRRWSDYIF